jgi:hypothetical protein
MCDSRRASPWGCFVGLTGVGGESLMTLVLVLLFGTQPSTAVGTDPLYALVTKSVGPLVRRSRPCCCWSAAAWSFEYPRFRIVQREAAPVLPAAPQPQQSTRGSIESLLSL